MTPLRTDIAADIRGMVSARQDGRCQSDLRGGLAAMKRVNGVWYYRGKAYADFRDALRAAWSDKKERGN